MFCVAILVDSGNVFKLCVAWVGGGRIECLLVASSLLCNCLVNSTVILCDLRSGCSSSVPGFAIRCDFLGGCGAQPLCVYVVGSCDLGLVLLLRCVGV